MQPQSEPPGAAADAGRRRANAFFVKMLQSALSRSESNIKAIPGLIGRVIGEGMWQAWDADERTFRPVDFRRFIEAPRPEGCETPIPLVCQLLAAEPSTLFRFEEMIRDERGGPNNHGPTQDPSTGKFVPTVNRDIITVDGTPIDKPDTIPIRPRDYSAEAPTGTSTSYALRRLRNHAPELLEKVHAGELTPNAAMVRAGLRQPHLQVKDDPEALAAYLLRKWDRERIAALLARLAEVLT